MAELLEDLHNEEAAPKPTTIHDLKPKMRLEGTVTRVELFGAFVDIGVGQDGLVHISQLSTQRVNRVSDVVKEGDQVTVWVLNVEPDRQRIDLTMIEPLAVEWDEIRPGQVYTGTVTRLERFGAFVDIGTTRDGLVHVSEITAEDYIRDPQERLSVGDEVQVKVLKVDRKRRRLELSIKALEEHLVEEVEEEEEPEEQLTAIELAWRQAQRAKRHKKHHRKKAQRRRVQDEIFARTLQLRDES